MFAINGVFAVVLKPVYGYIMDKIGMSEVAASILFCAISALMAPFFALVYQPLLQSHATLGIIIGALYLSLGWYAGAASESYADRFSRLYGLSLAVSECGVLLAGRWRLRSPDCCLTSRRWLTFFLLSSGTRY